MLDKQGKQHLLTIRQGGPQESNYVVTCSCGRGPLNVATLNIAYAEQAGKRHIDEPPELAAFAFGLDVTPRQGA